MKVVQPAVAALAGFYLSLLFSFALWAFVPLLLGWQPTVVMSGSMEPTVKAGDILVAETVRAEDLTPDDIKPGMVLLADNPLDKGTLYTHRVVDLLPDGRYVTKGDNNGSLDPEPLPAANIRGIEKLRVPGIGLPIQAIHSGNPLPLALFVIVTTLAVVIVRDDEKRIAAAKAAAAPEPSPASAPTPPHRRRTWPVGPRKPAPAPVVFATRREARRARQQERSILVRTIARTTTVMALGAALVIGGSTASFTATTMPPRSTWAASASFGGGGANVASCGGATYTASANTTLICSLASTAGTTKNYTLTLKGTGALVQWTVAPDWTGVANFSYGKAYGPGVSDTGNIPAKTGYLIRGNAGGSTNPADSWNHAWASSAKAAEVFTVQVTTTV